MSRSDEIIQLCIKPMSRIMGLFRMVQRIHYSPDWALCLDTNGGIRFSGPLTAIRESDMVGDVEALLTSRYKDILEIKDILRTVQIPVELSIELCHTNEHSALIAILRNLDTTFTESGIEVIFNLSVMYPLVNNRLITEQASVCHLEVPLNLYTTGATA